MNLMNGSRQFSSSSEDPEKKSSNDYESGFEKLMSEGKITKEESERFQQRREERAEQSRAEKEKFDKMHEEKSKEGERDFDDFLAGKKSQ